MKTIRIIQILALCLLVSCTHIDREKPVDKTKLLGIDYRLFQGTSAWELAKAVQDEDKKKIDQIVSQDPELLNYQEPVYGNTLLMLTIKNRQMKPFKILLEHKADMSIHNTFNGSTALMDACSYKEFDKFAEMLIEKGANVNDVQTDIENKGITRTPLMLAAGLGDNLGLVKLLVSRGANINYRDKSGGSALEECVVQKYYDIALFLLQNGADYTQPIYPKDTINDKSVYEVNDKPIYLVDELRADIFDLKSEKYKYKMQIVDFLKSKGIDYRAAPIPEEIKTEIQYRYPHSWEEYLKKY